MTCLVAEATRVQWNCKWEENFSGELTYSPIIGTISVYLPQETINDLRSLGAVAINADRRASRKL